MTPADSYDARETSRMQELHGSPLAPFWRRACAFVVDFLTTFVLFTAVVIPGGKVAGNYITIEGDVNLEFSFGHWYSFVALVVYFSLATWWGGGRTVGKRLFGIRVVSLAHRSMSLWHCVERALGYGASVLEFGFGFAQYFINPNRRTVHDRIAETIVVLDRPRKNRKDPRP